MRKPWMNLASTGAIVSALATLTCCLPPAILAAGGFAALAALPTVLRPWLLIISLGFLALGVFAAVRGSRCGVKPGKWNWILLGIAAIFVILTTLFPQMVAGFAADFFYRSER